VHCPEIFRAFPESIGVLTDLRSVDRPTFKATLGLLAQRRNLRPAFVDKKPLPERNAWALKELARDSNADIALETLQAWLIACRKDMLKEFLDALDVPHDGEGLIEELPAQPEPERLNSAIETLLTKWPTWEVSAYLNLFCMMDIADWPALKEIVATNPTLQPAEDSISTDQSDQQQ